MARISAEFFSSDPMFAKAAAELYGADASCAAKRYAKIADEYTRLYKAEDPIFFSAPGRIEIVGNHTDHNGGSVMAAAVTVDTVAAVGARGDMIVEIKSEGYPVLKADLNDLSVKDTEKGRSEALVKGVADYYIKHGKKVGGFNATTASDVPKAAGVSSSSSFELLVAEIFNYLYNGDSIDPVFMAKASQYAENVYFGKPCGLMDQTSIAVGGVNMIDFFSFDQPVVKSADWRFDDLDIYVIATGGDHSDLTADYAAIIDEMKCVAHKYGVERLIDMDKTLFYADRADIAAEYGERTALRAEHFFEEDERVDAALAAVAAGDEKAFLAAVNASGESSRYKLQNVYSPKSGNRNIERALDRLAQTEGILAKRVHGGGFAGTVLAFGERSDRDRLTAVLQKDFGAGNVYRVGIRRPGAVMLGF